MGAARKMTVEEWGELDDKDFRELVDGRLEDDEMPSLLLDVTVTWLVLLLAPYFRRRRGFVAAQGPKLVIRTDRGRVPDLACWGARAKPEVEGVIRTPPDLVVEIISPQRDRIDKFADYARMGVKQYWLVDPRVRTFGVFQLGSRRRYTSVAAASSGKIRRIPSLPGLTVDVDALWAELDRLSASA